MLNVKCFKVFKRKERDKNKARKSASMSHKDFSNLVGCDI